MGMFKYYKLQRKAILNRAKHEFKGCSGYKQFRGISDNPGRIMKKMTELMYNPNDTSSYAANIGIIQSALAYPSSAALVFTPDGFAYTWRFLASVMNRFTPAFRRWRSGEEEAQYECGVILNCVSRIITGLVIWVGKYLKHYHVELIFDGSNITDVLKKFFISVGCFMSQKGIKGGYTQSSNGVDTLAFPTKHDREIVSVVHVGLDNIAFFLSACRFIDPDLIIEIPSIPMLLKNAGFTTEASCVWQVLMTNLNCTLFTQSLAPRIKPMCMMMVRGVSKKAKCVVCNESRKSLLKDQKAAILKYCKRAESLLTPMNMKAFDKDGKKIDEIIQTTCPDAVLKICIKYYHVKRSMRRCAGCQVMQYCSKRCQKIHWNRKGHRIECARLRHNEQEKCLVFVPLEDNQPEWYNQLTLRRFLTEKTKNDNKHTHGIMRC